MAENNWYPNRPLPAAPVPSPPSEPGEVLGKGLPDWPEDLTSYAERKAYQRGVGDARRADKETPESNPWKEALDEVLVVSGLDCIGANETPEQAISRLLTWEVTVALDPAVSSAARALLERGMKTSTYTLLDARRYRWLRDVGDATWTPLRIRFGVQSPNQVDAIIDTAITKGTPA